MVYMHVYGEKCEHISLAYTYAHTHTHLSYPCMVHIRQPYLLKVLHKQGLVSNPLLFLADHQIAERDCLVMKFMTLLRGWVIRNRELGGGEWREGLEGTLR